MINRKVESGIRKPIPLSANINENLRKLLNDNLEIIAQLFSFIRLGDGDPEGNVSAEVGSLYLRTDGGTGTTFYVKETGTGNTGWVAK